MTAGQVEHLLRRAGFGGRPDELTRYAALGWTAAIDLLVHYEQARGTVDAFIGQPGFAAVRARGAFAPNSRIGDARQRWLFRMIHTERPLQEKMALFWHQLFATGYRKLAGMLTPEVATRAMAAVPGEDPAGTVGQIELFRTHALGNFRDLLIAVAQDPAMLVWLDGRLNVKAAPQENFARELMELFTIGAASFTEADVKSAARVFTGWNLRRSGARDDPNATAVFTYDGAQHDTGAKSFTFPVYSGGGSTIPSRSAGAGIQDGFDLLTALARHPETGRNLARRLWSFFVSELSGPPAGFLNHIAAVYGQSGGDMRATVRAVLLAPEFGDPAAAYARYAWPVEFVVQAIKEAGWDRVSLATALGALSVMGQDLYDPPTVGGWPQGQGWFSSGSMLARMNFAAALADQQGPTLVAAVRSAAASPDGVLSVLLDRFTPLPYDPAPREALRAYLSGGTAWNGSDGLLAVKVPGVVHLIVGSSEYQLV